MIPPTLCLSIYCCVPLAEVPRLQYSQYGLMDKYLNLKFPDAMVKPQGLMHLIMSEREVEIKVGDDGLSDVVNISINSIGALS
jgi:hypothetical protein